MEGNVNQELSNIFVIFGGTGDLTKRKLIPAIFSLMYEEKLPENFIIVAIGRRVKTNEEYRKEMYEYVEKFSRFPINDELWILFSKRIFYKNFDFTSDNHGYKKLDSFLETMEMKYSTMGNRLYYLAVAPEFFEGIIRNLKNNSMVCKDIGWQRIMIEKPFGSSLETARILNRNISKLIPEEDIFRIDHYLGKEMIQNILAIRFGNSLFEPQWNANYIDNIQITSNELLGVESRGGYYENTGILKDMLQNHILQMLTLIAMEPPLDLEPESIRDEKVKVLRSLRVFTAESFREDVVMGQYGTGTYNDVEMIGYREEDSVSKVSNTDTFIALKTYIDNFRWGGVPIYIRAGKRMNNKSTVIVIQFKKLRGINYYKEFKHIPNNLLVLKIQPEEGFFFQINAKKPGSEFKMEKVQLDYCQSCKYFNDSPEAYEKLILEALRNNSSLFTRWDELEHSWEFIESIEKQFKDNIPNYPNYSAGTQGPEAAIDLIKKDGRQWWNATPN
ncbi:glucose-6-phosphate dehydrogenase [Clostridium bowmanii]|uniref:glucose-6-phosphate dehydrogenase n=1 Tax=Clostridium bowmanii TaxID=132925 RepID=UPI001C0D7409|nr:glucose-6-phosphate dehydrogenase [Clostridium bowmanii]MBU3190781.1 glucose-6-phosphate dehydrogenase [Clostridium bowmanii]MCA1075315.1 glucose-6-phosphate dehydrogenase [Clostridium bowmanii]